MSKTIIDRTVDSKNKSSPNREKFMNRARSNIKKSLKKYIADDADIKSIGDGKEKKIRVSNKNLDEPQIVHSKNNTRKHVYIGNKSFEAGDEVDKPEEGQSSRSGSGPGDEGDDDFYFTLSHDEFVELFFEDLELPDLLKKQLVTEDSFQTRPAGFTTDGPPQRLDLLRTMKNSMKRVFAVNNSIDEEIEKTQALLDLPDLEDDKRNELLVLMEELLYQKENVPFIQELDLRYRKVEKVPYPVAKAVMVCMMDVSGSMSEWHKEMSKRFFMILYLFLTKQYDSVELVFVKYHHDAFEVDEQDFFYSPESGGTIVTKGLDLVNKIISERYDKAHYNVYVSHCSDGDTWREDDEVFAQMHNLLKKIQYYAYVNIDQKDEIATLFGSSEPDLLKLFKKLKSELPVDQKHKLELRKIGDVSEVYEVFRSLFEKRRK